MDLKCGLFGFNDKMLFVKTKKRKNKLLKTYL